MNRKEMSDALIAEHAEGLRRVDGTDHILSSMEEFVVYLDCLSDEDLAQEYVDWELS